jgi:hypothetical protein
MNMDENMTGYRGDRSRGDPLRSRRNSGNVIRLGVRILSNNKAEAYSLFQGLRLAAERNIA